MALGATMFRFAVDVSNVDRGVYANDEIVVARHPSESDALMLARVLAWAIEYEPTIQLGRGIAFPDEPGVFIAEDAGGMRLWIEVGAPAADRVHKAAKLCANVKIYAHRDLDLVLGGLRGKKIHRGGQIPVIGLQPLVQQLEPLLDRRNVWNVTVNEGIVYVDTGRGSVEFTPAPVPIDP
jgi:uncharacterized protein YaeQ